jgi:hypothetical protein
MRFAKALFCELCMRAILGNNEQVLGGLGGSLKVLQPAMPDIAILYMRGWFSSMPFDGDVLLIEESSI